MNRRRFLGVAAGLGVGAAAWAYRPHSGLANPCLGVLPPRLADNDWVRRAWVDVDARRVWDCHVHLVGVGDGDDGTWINPQLDSPLHPLQFAQKRFYLNAGCAGKTPDAVDRNYVGRLVQLVGGLNPGAKAMLLAFDWNHGVDGKPDRARSSFYTPNAYAQRMARAYPTAFEWAASIHPYRPDAVAALERAVADGARAVKWLPNAMNIDPASPRCDDFYRVLARHDLPLLSHAGAERAVSGSATHEFGNPLKLRRALDRGVRVILAHCASLGEDRDLDRGADGPRVPSFDLFARLMDEPAYVGRLFGDISALTQFDRAPLLRRILQRPAWHARLLNGSDYPLPGILPIYSASRFAKLGLLPPAAVPVLDEIQRHNALLFDFVLKRSLSLEGARLPVRVFETRSFFESATRDASV